MTLVLQALVGGEARAMGTKYGKPETCSWQKEAYPVIPVNLMPQCQACGPTCWNGNVPSVDIEVGLGGVRLWDQRGRAPLWFSVRVLAYSVKGPGVNP